MVTVSESLRHFTYREQVLNLVLRCKTFTPFQVGSIKTNKTGTSQVGAISKAQKAQNIFFGKKLEIFEKKISFGKCRTVPKNVKGGPFLICKHAFCSKITKNSKGGPFGDIKKNSKKNRTVPKKNRKRGPFSPVRACR